MSDLTRQTLRDLLYSVITGTTLSANTTSATDMLRSVISTSDITTPWSGSAYTYEISGYTVAQNVGVLYNFYVNTGSTLQTLNFGFTGDTALNTYISGSTLTIPSGVTVTEIQTVTTGTTVTPVYSLNISGSFGSSSTGGTSGTSGVSGSSGISGSSGTSGGNKYIISDISDEITGVTGTYYRCSGSTYQFILPATNGGGSWVLLKNLAGGVITVVPDGTDTIDQQSSKTTNYLDSFTFIDGAVGNWDSIA